MSHISIRYYHSKSVEDKIIIYVLEQWFHFATHFWDRIEFPTIMDEAKKGKFRIWSYNNDCYQNDSDMCLLGFL